MQTGYLHRGTGTYLPLLKSLTYFAVSPNRCPGFSNQGFRSNVILELVHRVVDRFFVVNLAMNEETFKRGVAQL